MSENYNLTKEDLFAKQLCNERGVTAEVWPLDQDGKFRVAVYKNEKLLTIRVNVWKYSEKLYAIHETYRSLVSKVIELPINGK